MLGPGDSAGRSSQAASDSDAAARQQTQIEYIASSNPRLVAMAVVRGSWFVARGSWLVARKSLPLCLNKM